MRQGEMDWIRVLLRNQLKRKLQRLYEMAALLECEEELDDELRAVIELPSLSDVQRRIGELEDAIVEMTE